MLSVIYWTTFNLMIFKVASDEYQIRSLNLKIYMNQYISLHHMEIDFINFSYVNYAKKDIIHYISRNLLLCKKNLESLKKKVRSELKWNLKLTVVIDPYIISIWINNGKVGIFYPKEWCKALIPLVRSLELHLDSLEKKIQI